ncbi:unnamed protein product, partial [Nesidiocoris tenuis]
MEVRKSTSQRSWTRRLIDKLVTRIRDIGPERAVGGRVDVEGQSLPSRGEVLPSWLYLPQPAAESYAAIVRDLNSRMRRERMKLFAICIRNYGSELEDSTDS